MRVRLAQQGLPDARAAAAMKNSDKVRYAGLVICGSGREPPAVSSS
jgi:hypothetical protein